MKADIVMSTIVDDIIAAIEAGADSWEMPWRQSFMLPTNATTGVTYRGGNVLACWLTGRNRAYPTQLWATYKQWASIDRQVAKGQHGLHLIKWSKIERLQHDGTVGDRMIPTSFVIFNEAQLDGGPEYEMDLSDIEPNVADMMLDLMMVPAKIEPGAPSYSPARDVVFMPSVPAFDEVSDYLATLAHELAHWSGHESRLARDLSGRFGNESYAIEELVAELSAVFTCGRYGVRPAARSDHAGYLANWCSVLKAQPSILWTVASKAQAATDHVVKYSEDALVSTTQQV